ncbi:MAG: aminoglycoside 2-N-acetyltransferase [Actinomycetota bacterium]|nr:aminoglycoside 2-N-acetyltransferase [Actinomycetota bacterium]
MSAARTLLEGAFKDFDLAGWALTFDGDELVGHASLVQRRLPHGDRVLNTGYVEGVAVHPEHRRRPTFSLTPSGIQRTEDDDGAVYVFPGRAPLDLDGELTADWRAGDVW